MKKGNYILWLASWYPDRFEPFNGDFIQRNARATASFIPITLFHFVQAGPAKTIDCTFEDSAIDSQLKEIIFYPKHNPIAFSAINTILYNNRFYAAAKKRLLKHFREHGLPLGVHVHIPIKAGNIALWIKRKWGLPYIVSEHSSHYLPAAPDAFTSRSALYRWQVRRVVKNAAAVTNVSKAIGDVMLKLLNLDKVVTIYNLADTRIFYFAAFNDDVFKFIHVSSLNEQKNIAGILRAFAELASKPEPWKLVLVGPESAALHSQVADLGLQQRVAFTGEIPYTEVAVQMRQANAFVLFSRHENFPCVIVEALCSGLPVVAADVAGVREAVNSQNGILVREGDEGGLVLALESILRSYSQYNRSDIAASAKAQYSAEKIGSQIFNLYKQYFGVRL